MRLQRQKYTKRQRVSVELSAVPIRVYHPEEKDHNKPVGVVRAKVVGAVGKPWYLLTGWAVSDAESAVRIFRFYRRRSPVEDTFKFIKTSLGIEAVQRLVAYGWVAAGFLFHLGLALEQPEVRLLAYLGGWEERKNRPPGKQVLTLRLRPLIKPQPRRFCVNTSKSMVIYRPLSSVCWWLLAMSDGLELCLVFGYLPVLFPKNEMKIVIGNIRVK